MSWVPNFCIEILYNFPKAKSMGMLLYVPVSRKSKSKSQPSERDEKQKSSYHDVTHSTEFKILVRQTIF